MYRPSDVGLLTAWERCHTAPHQASVPLSLLSAAYPDDVIESLARLSIGQRDAHLLQLREHLFGSSIAGLSECSSCGEVLEVSLDLATLRLPVAEITAEPIAIYAEEFELLIRLPNTLDLLAISSSTCTEAAQTQLLDRLVLSSTYRGAPICTSDLPEDIVQLIDSSLNSADPQANIQLNLVCVACDTVNEVLFDIGYLLWKEIDAWAIRLLRDIHELALAYGWNEAEITNMSSWRRRCYLEMLRA